MHSLRDYMQTLPPEGKIEFAARAETTLGYLKKSISARLPVGPKLALRLEKASHGAVSRYTLRPDIFGPDPEADPVHPPAAAQLAAKGDAV